MQFRISDTFTDSLARLTGEEQKAVKNTAFDLQMNPANPSFSFHKLDKARDKRFWSVRANLDLRLIVHKSEAKFVSHHPILASGILRGHVVPLPSSSL